MHSRRLAGIMALTVALVASVTFSGYSNAGAQAVASLPAGLYQGTCTSDSSDFVTDLEPIVPAALEPGAVFVGSDEAIDVAMSVTSLPVTLDELVANSPLAVIVSTGEGADAVDLSCGVIGGFQSGPELVFGIDDINDSGISGIGHISDDGGTVTLTIILGEFPIAETAAGMAAAATECVETEVAQVTAPHGPPAAGDMDGDSLDDTAEVGLGTDPVNPDTDGDGLIDGLETDVLSSDPLDVASPGAAAVDPDQDGLPDVIESQIGTDPANVDSDFDGIPDGWEFFLGHDPLDPESPADIGTDASVDPDQDGLTTRTEVELGTDPANPDTDFDGTSDGAEVLAGTNPRAASC